MPELDVKAPWSTEDVNPRTVNIDRVSTLEAVRLLHAEDHIAVKAVDAVLAEVARAAEIAADCWTKGGRWIFVGCGTSGRIAMSEAAELPPTFGIPFERAIAFIAGGPGAMQRAVEGAEDDRAAGMRDIEALRPTDTDLVVGLAASGRTPYVVGVLEAARRAGARTVAVVAVPGSVMCQVAEVAVAPDTGPEAILGSTRMKAGTAQKIVCNMITTAAMVRVGRVYENLMIDMRATNEKLRERAVRLVALGAKRPRAEAAAALAAADGSTKVATALLLLGVTADEAAARLDAVGGHVQRLLET